VTCFQFWAINPPLLAPLSDLKQFDQAAEIALLFPVFPAFVHRQTAIATTGAGPKDPMPAAISSTIQPYTDSGWTSKYGSIRL
jgi:hypothetical protein